MTSSNKTAFLQAYEPLHDRFARYCGSQAFGIMETEDLMQETILAALQGFDRLREPEKLLGYLIGIANNIVRNHRRRRKFRGEWDEAALEKLEARLDDPAVALDVQYLLKAMQQLPDTQREALALYELSGFSIREIAESQNTTEGAVKTRLSRARQQLRELLAEDGRPLSVAQRLSIYASVLL